LISDAVESHEAALRSTDFDVVVVPALQGLAAPHWRTNVRGAMFGLNRGTSSDDVVRATLDGIACRVCEVVQAMSRDLGQAPPYLKVDGGPTGNAYLMQMIANLLNLEVHVAQTKEATAVGIAQLAGVSAFGTSLDCLVRSWKAETVYRPGMSSEQREKVLSRWNKAIDLLKQYHD
jgi:glycerol kinase